MNDLILAKTELTMSSKDIAMLLNTRHDSVKRTIDRLVDKHIISRPPMVDGQKAANGIVESIYQIDKRSSYIIVAQLSPEFTAALVDRWQELEAKQAPKIPQTYSEALRLAADLQDKVVEQQFLIEQQKPAVEFVDRYVKSDGLKGFREVAKLLKIKEPDFTNFLTKNRIMYRLGGKLTAYQNHIDAGRFVVKAGTNESGYAFTETKFTPKGIEFIANLIEA